MDEDTNASGEGGIARLRSAAAKIEERFTALPDWKKGTIVFDPPLLMERTMEHSLTLDLPGRVSNRFVFEDTAPQFEITLSERIGVAALIEEPDGKSVYAILGGLDPTYPLVITHKEVEHLYGNLVYLSIHNPNPGQFSVAIKASSLPKMRLPEQRLEPIT